MIGFLLEAVAMTIKELHEKLRSIQKDLWQSEDPEAPYYVEPKKADPSLADRLCDQANERYYDCFTG